MDQLLRAIINNAALRVILEMLGIVESQQALIQQQLNKVSRALPQGQATLVVRSLGEKENSAVSTIRQVTGLSLTEVLTLTQLLPFPLLTRVSVKTAVSVQRRLSRVGIETEIVGVEEIELQQAKSSRQTKKSAVMHAPADSSFPTEPGDYSVTLTSLGLLEVRVLEGVERITGQTVPTVNHLAESLPLTLLTDVDQDTAIKAQTMLQMVGAVVDIDEKVVDQHTGLAVERPAPD